MGDPAVRWPDFLIIGAAKAGTTALFKAIGRHPRVFCPAAKEPRFLSYAGAPPAFRGPHGESHSRRVIARASDYHALFSECPPGSLACEASTEYLSCTRAPATAARFVPDVRLIVMLRHPVDRAFSQFLHHRAEDCEPLDSFEDAWEAGGGRVASGWRPSYDHRGRCLYAAHLERWRGHFPAERMLILFYEDWLQRPRDVLSRVWRHLGLEPIESPVVTRENVTSRLPRWPWLHHRMVDWDNPVRRLAQQVLPLPVRDAITRTATAINSSPGPRLDPKLRSRLARTYQDDLSVLEGITGRQLDDWRS